MTRLDHDVKAKASARPASAPALYDAEPVNDGIGGAEVKPLCGSLALDVDTHGADCGHGPCQAAGAAASAVARVAPAAGAPPLAPLEAGARSGAPSRGGRCNRCGGSDSRCLRCIASRLGRKHGGALDGEGGDGRGLMPRAELAAVGVASCD